MKEKHIKKFNELSDISDVIKRKNNGEKLSQEEDWLLHCWLYDNDKQYKKAWEDAVDRVIKKK